MQAQVPRRHCLQNPRRWNVPFSDHLHRHIYTFLPPSQMPDSCMLLLTSTHVMSGFDQHPHLPSSTRPYLQTSSTLHRSLISTATPKYQSFPFEPASSTIIDTALGVAFSSGNTTSQRTRQKYHISTSTTITGSIPDHILILTWTSFRIGYSCSS